MNTLYIKQRRIQMFSKIFKKSALRLTVMSSIRNCAIPYRQMLGHNYYQNVVNRSGRIISYATSKWQILKLLQIFIRDTTKLVLINLRVMKSFLCLETYQNLVTKKDLFNCFSHSAKILIKHPQAIIIEK